MNPLFRPSRRPLRLSLAVAWLAVVTVPPALLLAVRSSWLEQLARPSVQNDWDEFRSDMAAQSGRDAPVPGPVQRKVPRSAEPPLRVWLRDHVGLAIAAWVLFGSVLFGFLAATIVGLLAENQPRGRRDAEKDQEGDGENAQQGKHEKTVPRVG
jgi:hypothetical protein